MRDELRGESSKHFISPALLSSLLPSLPSLYALSRSRISPPASIDACGAALPPPLPPLPVMLVVMRLDEGGIEEERGEEGGEEEEGVVYLVLRLA